MPVNHVLHIPYNTDGSQYVLVDVSPNGPEALDLKLIATDGENPFVATVKHSRISRLQGKNSPVDIAQWEIILRSVLLQERRDADQAETLKNLETVATVAGDQLILGFRKNISGIHQRLGEISLLQDENQEIDTLAWINTAVSRGDKLETEVADLETRYNEQDNVLKKLRAQLDDLICAKKEHEDALLEKFRELLNSKKLKIRDQQRLLATAKVDPDQASAIQATRSASATHRPGPSRPRKRKPQSPASASPPTLSGSDSEEPYLQDVPVDDPHEAGRPDKSDLDATEDEADDDDLDDTPGTTTAGNSGVGNTGKENEAKKRTPSPPPRRELPFDRIGRWPTEEQKVAAAEEDGTRAAGKEDMTRGSEYGGNGMDVVGNADGDETTDDEL